ncbi:G-type lectin S-receptor-like serine/threonine-protein kinase SD2-5 [Triticum dicoccoides]|uniref:G-type lectin S-receptor-like serine/threonine-protein kinase SD2-5 n=1 Tax=Triticum dicoccoides TaxID=85692 RepID=UPI001890F689|nr:G-type lectin S-receptor-like serine/threonine-protein kinase SD2-5 [Triticum dicoccoides]
MCDEFLFAVFIYPFRVDNPQVVWSANRACPVRENTTLTFTRDGNLVLHDADGSHVWSSNSSGRSVVGIMLTEIGNLVLFDHRNATVWQSFDHPTDTLIVGQSLEEGMRLTANTSPTNWTENQFYITVCVDGLYAFVESTPPQCYFSDLMGQNKTGNDPTRVTFMTGSLTIFGKPGMPDTESYMPLLPATDSIKYMRLESNGHLRLYTWSGTEWNVFDVFSLRSIQSEVVGYNSSAYLKVQLSPSNENKKKVHLNPSSENKKVILGATVGAVTTLVLLVIVVTLFLRRRKYEEKDEFDFDQLPGMLARFSFKKLSECTEGFSKKLGDGGFGSVFQGELGEDKVAVKRLEGARQGKKEFLAEVETIGSIEHINLVRLIGFCAEKSERLLVYEYMSRGSLDRWIYYRHNNAPLDWCTRSRIILDIAKGLCYLHEECRHIIAHLDIKPQNILLDDNFNAKVADFGLCKLINRDQSKVVTMMRGTPGYLAPEWLTSRITEKVDVYSFGVVLMEIVSGRKNIDTSQPEEDVQLINLLREKAQNNHLSDLIDMHGEDMVSHQEEVIQMLKLAIWCLQQDSIQRPSMSTVIKALEGAISIQTFDANSVMSVQDNPSTYSVTSQTSMLSGPR